MTSIDARRSTWVLRGGIALVAVALITGVLQLFGLPGGDEPDASPAPRIAPAPSISPSAPPSTAPGTTPGTGKGAVRTTVLRVGRVGTLLTAQVRNDSTERVRTAVVRLTARGRDGRVIPTTGAPRSSCCQLIDLAPGEAAALWANVARDAPSVATVDAHVLSADVAPASASAPSATVTVSEPRLERGPDSARVTARLSADGSLDGYVAAQALVVDADGGLVAVVSGRFWCFDDGVSRVVRMDLPERLPEGVRLESVDARPVPDTALPSPSACS